MDEADHHTPGQPGRVLPLAAPTNGGTALSHSGHPVDSTDGCTARQVLVQGLQGEGALPPHTALLGSKARINHKRCPGAGQPRAKSSSDTGGLGFCCLETLVFQENTVKKPS